MIEVKLGDNRDLLKEMLDSSIDLVVTSPPYYNARSYATWSTFEEYMLQMRETFELVYRKLKNHHYIVVNVSDIVAEREKGVHKTKRKIPLAAYFGVMLDEIGFQYIDDFIWDKGEVESKRHLGNPPYPYYQYPLNCYEHIFVYVKHEYNKTKIACPLCGSLSVRVNGEQRQGVCTFECSNPDCVRSKSNRGYRFGEQSIMMHKASVEANEIPKEFIKQYRRDIVKINPVVKVNCKGEMILKHTAAYPKEIPELAIRYFSCVGDLVVDIFCGSGTTGVVCKELKRKFIGMEYKEEYVELSRQRIADVKL